MNWQPKPIFLIIIKLNIFSEWTTKLMQLFFHVFVVVLNINILGLIRKHGIFKQVVDREGTRADQVIRGNNILIPSLNIKHISLSPLRLNWEYKSIVKAGLATLASPMGISRVVVLGVEECADKDIASAFYVHHFNISCFPNNKSYFKFLHWLRINVDRWQGRLWRVNIMNLHPKLNDSLRDRTRIFIKIPVLNGLVLDCKPALAIEPVVKVNFGDADKIVAEEAVIIISLDHHTWRPRKLRLKLKAFKNLRLGCIELIIISLIKCFFATSYL